MASITTRQTGTTGVQGVTRKDLPLTNAEIDNNFINLNNNKLETSNNLSDLASASTARSNLGLGTIATQAANNVTLTGGSITGITDLAVADGGTGASNASGARTNLGLTIGTDVQAFNGNLSGLSSLNSIGIVYRSASNTFTAGNSLGNVDLQVQSLGVGTAASGTSGRIDAGTLVATSITETSSITLKQNINPIENALLLISKLDGVTYDRKDGSSKNEAGLIAEDVQKILPNLVSSDGIQYTKLTAYLIEAVKTLKKEIDDLKGIK
jgi:hypothetical protein